MDPSLNPITLRPPPAVRANPPSLVVPATIESPKAHIEFIPPDTGYTAEQRVETCSRLRGFLARPNDRPGMLDLFVRGLQNDFSSERATDVSTCPCNRRADTILAVEWNARIDTAEKSPLRSLLLRPFGFLAPGRQWRDFHVTTCRAACAACAKSQGRFDRFERLFGPIPRVLRRGKVHRFPFQPTAPAPSDRGDDLCYSLTISRAEEVGGFTRTISYHRTLAVPSSLHPAQAHSETMLPITVPRGWTAGHPRRTGCDFHYALRLRGGGNGGRSPGNDGDLFITITVQD